MIAYQPWPEEERESPPAHAHTDVGQVGDQMRDDAELTLYHACAQASLGMKVVA